MGKRTSTKTTVEGYLQALSRRLRWSLPRCKVDAVIAETAAHLHEHVTQLIDDGAAPLVAESEALSGFGRVSAYSRAIVHAAFEDRHSTRARIAAAIFGLGLCCFLVSFSWIGWIRTPDVLQTTLLNSLPPFYDSTVSRGAVLFIVLFATFLLFASIGKRPQPLTYLLFGLLLAPITFFYSGINQVSVPVWGEVYTRHKIAAHHFDAAYEAQLGSDIRLLRLGCQVFDKDDVVIPAALLDKGKIIIPNVDCKPRTLETDEALREYDVDGQIALYHELDIYDPAYDVRLHALSRAMPYFVTTDKAAAKKAWRAVGRPWLGAMIETREQFEREERKWAVVKATVPNGFAFPLAIMSGLTPLVCGIYFAFFDALAALTGRFLFRSWKNWRNGTYA